MKATINLKLLNAVAIAASKEETRYYLGGVFVEIFATHAIYTATDGHRLITARENVPNKSLGVDAKGKATPPEPVLNTLVGSWIVPLDTCKAAKPKKGRVVVDHAELTIDSNVDDLRKLKLRLTSTNGVLIFEPINGSFPDYRRVIPLEMTGTIEDDSTGVAFNPAYVGSFGDFSKLLELGNPEMLYNGAGPTAVIWPNHGDVLGVLMPMRASSQTQLARAYVDRRQRFGIVTNMAASTEQKKAA